MCTRTKTSYGCGHEYKTTSECESSRCKGLDRYHYPKDGDCRNCKLGGDAVTRGREGKGRYAREISRRSPSRARSTESSDIASLDMGGGISPWASPLKREKEWHSPSRRKADEAWLHEHGERSSDLQTIRDSASSCPSSDGASTTRGLPTRDEGHVYEIDHDLRFDHDPKDDHHRHHRRDIKDKTLEITIRGAREDHDGRGRRPIYVRSRHDSQESFKSSRSGHSSSWKYKPAPTTYTTYEQYDRHDSGYGSYGSRASNGHEGAKTEPYMYSPSLRIKAPATSYDVYQTSIGHRNVDIVSRTPVYALGSRRY